MPSDAELLVLARSWFEAWNLRDLDAIIRHYDEEVEFTTPYAREALGIPDGTVRGRTRLMEYFAGALRRYPELEFRDASYYVSVGSVAIRYESVNGRQAVEVLWFNDMHKCYRAYAHYMFSPTG